MKRIILTSLVFIVWSATSFLYGAHIFFDADGVLMSNKKLATMWQIGPSKFIGNPIRMANIKKLLFHFLSTVQARTSETPLAYHQGMVMPQIMCDWQMGTKTPEQIRAQITAHMETPRAQRFFKKYGCKKAITALCDFMFDPEKLAASMDVIDDGVQLLKKCKDAGHKVYILSNHSKEAFACLSTSNSKIKELFALCDGIVVSGEVGCMKPDADMFTTAFARYNVDADTEITVFFDDESVNVAAAQMLGKKKLYAAHIKNKKYGKAYELLEELRIL